MNPSRKRIPMGLKPEPTEDAPKTKRSLAEELEDPESAQQTMIQIGFMALNTCAKVEAWVQKTLEYVEAEEADTGESDALSTLRIAALSVRDILNPTK